MRKTQISKANHLSKKWCNYCQRYAHSIAECRQKQQDNQNKPQKYKEPNKSFYQYMKKDQNFQTKTFIVTTALVNHFQIIQITQETNHPIILVIEVDHQNKEIHEISHKIDIVDQIVKKNQYRNNYSRSISNRTEFFDTSSHSNSRNRHYSNDRSRNSSYNRKSNYSNNRNTKTVYQEIFHTTDPIINEQITTTTIIDHEKVHKIGIQTITINKGIILNLLIEILRFPKQV